MWRNGLKVKENLREVHGSVQRPIKPSQGLPAPQGINVLRAPAAKY